MPSSHLDNSAGSRGPSASTMWTSVAPETYHCHPGRESHLNNHRALIRHMCILVIEWHSVLSPTGARDFCHMRTAWSQINKVKPYVDRCIPLLERSLAETMQARCMLAIEVELESGDDLVVVASEREMAELDQDRQLVVKAQYLKNRKTFDYSTLEDCIKVCTIIKWFTR